jgi:GTP pyrophosphokinase
MRKVGLPLQKIFAGQAFLELSHDLHYPDIESMYAAVGNGHISAQFVIEKLVANTDLHEPDTEVESHASPVHSFEHVRRNSTGVDVEGADDVLVKLARWVDLPVEDRHVEFRALNRSAQPMNYVYRPAVPVM